MTRAAGQYAGESASDYVARIESELERASERIERLERDAETESDRCSRLREEYDSGLRDRDFLREQLEELALQIGSPSAPRTKQQMGRLLHGMLSGHDWRNGAWRR